MISKARERYTGNGKKNKQKTSITKESCTKEKNQFVGTREAKVKNKLAVVRDVRWGSNKWQMEKKYRKTVDLLFSRENNL